MFQVVFEDPTRTVLADARLEIGTDVEIDGQTGGDGELVNLIKGEVTSIEFEYDARGGRAIVRGYDKSHRLAAGRKTATFQQVTYSDIASQIASDSGLTPEVDDTEGVFEHVFQVNQSNLDFLYGLARLANRDFRVDGDKLLFKKPVPSGDGPEAGDADTWTPDQLICGENLLEFRARVSAVGQVAEGQGPWLGPQGEEGGHRRGAATAAHAQIRLKPADLAAKTGGETLVVVNHGVTDAETADARRQGAGRSRSGAPRSRRRRSPSATPGSRRASRSACPASARTSTGKWVITGSRHEFVDGQLPHPRRVHRTPGPLASSGWSPRAGAVPRER